MTVKTVLTNWGQKNEPRLCICTPEPGEHLWFCPTHCTEFQFEVEDEAPGFVRIYTDTEEIRLPVEMLRLYGFKVMQYDDGSDALEYPYENDAIGTVKALMGQGSKQASRVMFLLEKEIKR